jgi:serine/threonine protein phosphatase 1
MRTFAIGDVHGQLALLVDLLARIDAAGAGEPSRIVCIGDYVDRGPDSAGVVNLLRTRQEAVGRDRFICLKGNHEDMLLRARESAMAELLWLENGGVDCLASFGVRSVDELPPDIVAWIEACPTYFEDDLRCYVHAGLDPARGRLDQVDGDRLWIREAFLAADHDFGRYVVHGHTPRRDGRPDVTRHRVNLDTAAAYGGPLTVAMFVDDRETPAEFMQAWP